MRYGGKHAPAWVAVCALVEQTGMPFDQAAQTPMHWLRRWRLYRDMTRPDPPAEDYEE